MDGGIGHYRACAYLEEEEGNFTDTTGASQYGNRFRIVFALLRSPDVVLGRTKWCFEDEWPALINWCEHQEWHNLPVRGDIDIHNLTLPPHNPLAARFLVKPMRALEIARHRPELL